MSDKPGLGAPSPLLEEVSGHPRRAALPGDSSQPGPADCARLTAGLSAWTLLSAQPAGATGRPGGLHLSLASAFFIWKMRVKIVRHLSGDCEV